MDRALLQKQHAHCPLESTAWNQVLAVEATYVIMALAGATVATLVSISLDSGRLCPLPKLHWISVSSLSHRVVSPLETDADYKNRSFRRWTHPSFPHLHHRDCSML